jgi:arylsulfatase A-like enzyme
MTHPNYGPSDAYNPDELRNLRAHYAAEAELVDRWVGRVLQKIGDLDLWDETVVVVTSDHGMSIGEHARTGKSNIHERDERYWPLYPELGHVPFLIAAPGLPRGVGVQAFGQPCDFLPTVCDLAGVASGPPEPFHGGSMANVLRSGGGTHRDCAVSGCFATSPDGNCPARSSTPFLVTERWGFAPIGAHGEPELFDLDDDPYAETNVAHDRPDLVRDMRDLLAEHLRDAGAPEATMRLWSRDLGGSEGGTWARDYAD